MRNIITAVWVNITGVSRVVHKGSPDGAYERAFLPLKHDTMVPIGIWSLLAVTLTALVVHGKLSDGRAHLNVPPRSSLPLPPGPPPSGPVTHVNGTVLADISTPLYINIPIDHKNASLGTFSTRYWVNYQYYQPGE